MPSVPGVIIDPWYDIAERAKVRIQAVGVGGVTGIVPAPFGFGFSNSWRAPFADIAARFNTGVQLGQDLVNKFRGREGTDTLAATLQEVKTQIWTGGSTIAFSLNLFYLARRGATLDVVNPIKRLTKLSAPSAAGRVEYRTAAGGTLSATAVNRPPVVQVEVGYILRLKKAIIKSMNVSFPENVTDFNGQPTEAMVTLQVESDKMFLSDDTEVDFLGGTINRWGA